MNVHSGRGGQEFRNWGDMESSQLGRQAGLDNPAYELPS